MFKYFVFAFFLILFLGIAIVGGVYATRLSTIGTLTKVTNDPEGYDLYKIDILYDYRLDKMLSQEYSSDKMVGDAIVRQAIPLLPVHLESPDYSCSAFGITDHEGKVLMGRNYDFDIDTSALLVHCAPKKGYESIAMAALDHVGLKKVTGLVDKLTTLPAPFICLDGMNEKGVSIAVLMLDANPVYQETGKPGIFTTLAVRLVLDRAATTQEAVELLRGYDMFSVAKGDYHFFLTDASGDGRVVEYDPHDEARRLVDTPVRSATNFYQLYIDQVLPNQHNDIYGHGRERYDMMEKIFTENEGRFSRKLAWEALEAARQLPRADDKTSNTQWSVVYDDTDLTAELVLRRNWGKSVFYRLRENTLTASPS